MPLVVPPGSLRTPERAQKQWGAVFVEWLAKLAAPCVRVIDVVGRRVQTRTELRSRGMRERVDAAVGARMHEKRQHVRSDR